MKATVIVQPTGDLDDPVTLSVDAGLTINQVINAYGGVLGYTTRHVATVDGLAVRDYATVLQNGQELVFRVGSKERGN